MSKPPRVDAPREEHQRYAAEVLEREDLKLEPEGGMVPNDEVAESGEPDEESEQ